MQQLIKRLELIKSCILLGDDELIPSQLAKIPLSDDQRINEIIIALNQAQFSHAIALIEAFISRVSGLIVYEDPLVAGLRLELKSLEQRLIILTEEKQVTIHQIAEFRMQYHLALGELLQTILDLNYRIAYQKMLNKRREEALIQEDIRNAEANINALKERIKKLNNSDLNNDQIEELTKAISELKAEQTKLQEAKVKSDTFEKDLIEDNDYQEYQQAKADKEKFEEELEEINEQHSHELPEDEKKQLKKAYRKAAKLCHPDTVADEFKEQAHELMTALNVAYLQQDLKEILRILYLLETGGGFITSSDKINNSEALKVKITEISAKVTNISTELERLKQDDVYQRIELIDDWQVYFDQIKNQLLENIGQLEVVYQELIK
jgi:hypothetical protein